MSKILTRSNSNVMVSGVCAGIAEYFNIDPTIIRLVWVAFCWFGGSGILFYLICSFVIPRNEYY